ncbi:MAG TPA: hypothetical protein VKZ87_10275 [Ferrovibrio sp.]|jgi:hypothetical protein|uniref:hypothetical protein n=1 Tax=Ferrovibrio sp. TaxID=1917215 RepID=UPI002B4AF739|nr:hypothetical protein [Ferrovibrio sp.]HLT77763.1 hypothetical protein [Ferrovibrio sp.]
MKRAMIYALAAGLVLGTGSLSFAQSSGSPGTMQSPTTRSGPSQPGTAASPGSSQSQVPESEVRRALEAHGFTDVKNVRQSGDIITADAKKDGKQQKVEIDTIRGTFRTGS